PRVFVIGAAIGRGGAYMAYHVGRIAARRLGGALVNVDVGWRGGTLFAYETPMQTLPLDRLEHEIAGDDLLICNPSFSPHMFGLRLSCRKLMYVQDFITFRYLDCRFDAYVAVSSVVARFLSATYGIDAPVIPAFIDADACAAFGPPPAARRIAVHLKNDAPEHRAVFEFLKPKIAERCGEVDYLFLSQGRAPHWDFLRQLSGAPFLLNICIAEGFGLVPLEAMAMGRVVAGLDGLGGQDFLRYGQNSLAVPPAQMERVPETVERLLADPALAARLSREAAQTAGAYTHAAFERAWEARLDAFLA
ncbi:MAG: glycosyltransferase, partial [Alphaproteobacteria bacterium]|nr:glycosyltransferase [Alphaproteobacteria bacterium]